MPSSDDINFALAKPSVGPASVPSDMWENNTLGATFHARLNVANPRENRVLCGFPLLQIVVHAVGPHPVRRRHTAASGRNDAFLFVAGATGSGDVRAVAVARAADLKSLRRQPQSRLRDARSKS